MIAFNLTVLIVLALVIFKFPSNIKSENSFLERDATSTWRGMAIIGIILHHIALHTDYNVATIWPVKFFINECGYIFTGLFFLFSGFGCYYSIGKLGNSEVKTKLNAYFIWFLKHFVRIFLDCVIVLVLDVVLLNLFTSQTVTFQEIIKDMFTLSVPLWTSWYPKIQILCYLILTLASIISKKHKEYFVLAMVVLYIVAARIFDLPTYWYNSVICFPLGIFFAKYYNSVKTNKNQKWVITVISAVVFAVLYFLQAYLYSRIYIVSDLFRILSAIAFSVFVISSTGIYKFNNKILKAFGNSSFECYLLHLVAISILSFYNIESNIAVSVIVLSTIVLAIPINKFVSKLMKKFR